MNKLNWWSSCNEGYGIASNLFWIRSSFWFSVFNSLQFSTQCHITWTIEALKKQNFWWNVVIVKTWATTCHRKFIRWRREFYQYVWFLGLQIQDWRENVDFSGGDQTGEKGKENIYRKTVTYNIIITKNQSKSDGGQNWSRSLKILMF